MSQFDDHFNKWVFPHSFGTVYGIEETAAALEVLQDGAPTNSVKVREFEEKFAEYVGGEYGIAVNSWGSGAQLVASVLELCADDEVIVPAWTMSASANLFAREGAKIVFADVDEKTGNLDPEKLERIITKHTRAVVAVHMCGQPCELDRILEITKKHHITLIQDAAHAPGALYQNRKLGAYGDFVIYSFHQAKNMATLGEGGMVVMNSRQFRDRLHKLRSHGMGEYIGFSCRMTDIQAAVGLVQLGRLAQMNEKRRELSYYLSGLLKDCKELETPYETKDVYHTYHLYRLRLKGISREKLKKILWTKGRIMTIAYDPTLNCLECYQKLGHRAGECPVAEAAAANMLILPLSPAYTREDMETMAYEVKRAVKLCVAESGGNYGE